jgi:5-methylcytosine-specific restriction endonuclease McrBC GTP-binding regulatory subunit McrB
MKARVRRSATKNERAAVWAHLQMHTDRDCPNVAYTKRYEPLLFSKSADSVWSIDDALARSEVPELAEALEKWRRYQPSAGDVVRRYEFVTFHQSYSYEEFVEGIKPTLDGAADGELSYEVKAGIFRQIASRAMADPGHDYAIFIDEINRGNIASILGELITLLEDDKRLGAKQELTARLPYSRQEFGVPPNLYVIGTMNTADRSVEALDAALRRRFHFVECAPKPELLADRQPVGLPVNLVAMLTTINGRLERLRDRDHCIGHSYFWELKEQAEPLVGLRQVFANKVMPLLREYFYGDPGKIARVLGPAFVRKQSAPMPFASGSDDTDDDEEREVYEFTDIESLGVEAFQAIYEKPNTGL